MIALAAVPDQPPALLRPPAIVAPAAHEVSFGRIAGTVSPGTRRVVVAVDGRTRLEARVRGRRFSLRISLPRKDAAVRVTAVDARGNRASSVVRPVFGLPRAAAPVGFLGHEDARLARRVRELVRGFPGIAAVFVQDLRTGAGAAWNARARFPAASTLKLAIAVEVLRVLEERPQPGSRLDELLRRMLVDSDNGAANALEVWLGGSTSGGSARVNALLRALGLTDSEMYGGYELTTAAGRRPIPIRVESQPGFGVGKHTTAWDMARLFRYVHLAAGGKGALLRLRGSFTAADGRYLLWVLVRTADRGKLDRFVAPRGDVAVAHKAGWIATARHDTGLVYWPDGCFVAAVMTWNGAGTGASADILAGRVAQAALERFRELRRERARAPEAESRSA